MHKSTDQQLQLIGVFDSGVGGLSVVRAIQAEMPEQPILYIADQEHVPYGERSLEEVRSFAHGISAHLIDQGASLVVVACNTASAAALRFLRQTFPQTPFVGMEPAIKPAALETHSSVIGVLATPATFEGEPYHALIDRFGRGVRIITDTCPDLVMEIEKGNLEGKATRRILEKAILPMLEQGVDTLVLGCTHYPFVFPLIREIAGGGLRIIDPAPAVARRTKDLLAQQTPEKEYQKYDLFSAATSKDPEALAWSIDRLLHQKILVRQIYWQNTHIKVYD